MHLFVAFCALPTKVKRPRRFRGIEFALRIFANFFRYDLTSKTIKTNGLLSTRWQLSGKFSPTTLIYFTLFGGFCTAPKLILSSLRQIGAGFCDFTQHNMRLCTLSNGSSDFRIGCWHNSLQEKNFKLGCQAWQYGTIR